ncbi:MAG: hypothetical protein PHX47_02545 [Candidatus ainarchaeum sp.]|nr:hypothetical protein [Candidatus ainarchaeum sp.]
MEEDTKLSKFSSGLNILMRVDQLWKNCHDFKRRGLYQKWNDELDSVWLELSRDLSEKQYNGSKDKENTSEEEKEGYKKLFEDFEKRLKYSGRFYDSGSLGFLPPTKEMLEDRDKQYKILMEKQLFLARLENKLGKGTSWEDEEDEDF